VYYALIGKSEYKCIFDFQISHEPYLREWSKNDTFSCPSCHTGLAVKMGKTKRWHFAHKEGSPDDCPLKFTDLSNYETISAIYEWLKGIPFVEELVVEYLPQEMAEPTLVDFKFRIEENRYLYKVIGKRTSRKKFNTFEQLREWYILNYIFTEGTLKEAAGQPKLNSTHRTCYSLTDEANKADEYVFGEALYKGFFLVVDLREQCIKKLKTINEVDLQRCEMKKKWFFIPFDSATVSKMNGEIVFWDNAEQ
jgi:hypothetical protein